MKDELLTIHRKSIDILSQFSTSYMCEQGFSYLTSIKSKDRNRLLTIEKKIHVCLSEAPSRNKYSCSKS